ncbi:glycosyltransferase family 9 protein [Pelagibacteraceae bacterium]|jgi:heptosyltransferase II|nr:glycosyltransferase family 9 protein [Pelagibacteraceae bacterium]
MKVLVIQPKIGMGDMIIYLPYIHAIAKKYNTKASILVKKNSRATELLTDDLNIDEIIHLDRNKKKSGTHDGFKGFFKLAKEIKLKKFDKIFIFSSSIRYFLIAKITGVKNISQYPLFRSKDNVVLSAKIFTENILNEIVSTQPNIYLKDSKVNQIKNNFDHNYLHICLGISASGPTKRWNIYKYIHLCEKLSNVKKCKFYVAGGKNDKELVDLILKSQIGSSVISFVDLKIQETMPIIKNCNLYIGNDTGWLHISSALGLKCLGIFMDSPVVAYGKYSKNIKIIVPDGETEESTTHNTRGENRISIEKVYSEVIKLLN